MVAEPPSAIGVREFSAQLAAFLPAPAPDALAVAVSGGPDSMALAFLLSRTFKGALHALIVDHGLRPEAAEEARAAKKILGAWPRVKPVILKWEGAKPKTRVQEAAREARYRLMADYCARHKIAFLCLAHHLDDQAETILFRLAKGSGLDGLSGMRPVQNYAGGGGLCLLRPLLGASKADLIETCRASKIPFALDPGNKNLAQARPRLRQSAAALAAEGLTPQRLAHLGLRMARGRDALEHYAAQEAKTHAHSRARDKIVYRDALLSCPAEILVRIILKDMIFLAGGEGKAGYGPRLERVEAIAGDLRDNPKFRKRTLGGVIFTHSPAQGLFTLQKEKGAAPKKA